MGDDEMNNSTDTKIAQAKTALRLAREDLAAEISSYPTPISGCDAQFNHMLAQRTQIGQAIAALEAEVFVPTPRTPMLRSGIESR
jgi:hypothetical protein